MDKKLKKQQESLNTTDNKESNSNEELIKWKPIDNTPFILIKQNEKYFGAIGNHRITEYHDNEKECEKDILEMSWNRIVQVILACQNINLKDIENE